MAMSCSRVRMSMSAATRSMCRFAAATGKKKLAVTELLDLRQREMMRIAITVVSKPSQGSFQEIENVQDCKDRLRPRYWDGLLLARSEEHTSELQSLMRISYAVFCLKKKTQQQINTHYNYQPQ